MNSGQPIQAADEKYDWDWTSQRSGWVPPALDTGRPSAARIYDYLLGGKDNFAVDRQAAARFEAAVPDLRRGVRANRSFLERAVDTMAGEYGIDQFIDFGTGLPYTPNVHEVARRRQPHSRIVYIDHDPVVVAHGRALLAGEPGVVMLANDLREPSVLLDDLETGGWIDFSRPVGLLFVGVLHFVPLDPAPGVLARYRCAVPPGSCLAISAACRTGSDPRLVALAEAMYAGSGTDLYFRTSAQVGELFEGFTPVEPGLTDVTQWRSPKGGPLPVRALAGLAVR